MYIPVLALCGSPLGTARIIKPADLVSARLLVCREHRLNQRIGEKICMPHIPLLARLYRQSRRPSCATARMEAKNRLPICCGNSGVPLKRTLISGVARRVRKKRQCRKRFAGIKLLVPLCRRLLKKCLKTAIVSLHGENEFTQIAFSPRAARDLPFPPEA